MLRPAAGRQRGARETWGGSPRWRGERHGHLGDGRVTRHGHSRTLYPPIQNTEGGARTRTGRTTPCMRRRREEGSAHMDAAVHVGSSGAQPSPTAPTLRVTAQTGDVAAHPLPAVGTTSPPSTLPPTPERQRKAGCVWVAEVPACPATPTDPSRRVRRRRVVGQQACGGGPEWPPRYAHGGRLRAESAQINE